MYSKPQEITIYEIQCGKERYIGSTVNLKSRLRQHHRDLFLGRHHNSFLQEAYLTSGLVNVIIHKVYRTRFRYKRFKVEQRYINAYATCNIAVASSSWRYSWKEFFIDVLERII